MNKFLTALIALLLLPSATLHAQEQPEPAAKAKLPLNVAFDVRADFTIDNPDGPDPAVSGIHGRYLNVMLDGRILPNLSYAWRQRFNKFQDLGNDIFSATDWIYLRYDFTPNWSVSAGKEVVLIGGYEYDAAPIDIFFASRFWNNIACYQFGATATYTTNDGRHAFSAQVCNSPYTAKIATTCYAYNLFWAGNMGNYHTLWSVNMVEYEHGHYANFISLGNRLTLDKVDLQLDLMNRATRHHKFIAGDYTVIGKASYAFRPWITAFVKGGYDEFKSLPHMPEHVDNPFYGAGVEVYPLKGGSRNLRLHVVWDRISDNDGNMSTQFNVGLKWRVDLYHRQ